MVNILTVIWKLLSTLNVNIPRDINMKLVFRYEEQFVGGYEMSIKRDMKCK